MRNYAGALLSLLKNVVKEGPTAVCAIQCLIKRINEIEATEFTADEVATIVSSCTLYPGSIILLGKLSSTAHGQQMVSKAKSVIDKVIHILTGHRQFLGCATSILLDYILRNCDSCLISEYMKDADVAVKLLDILDSLDDEELLTNPDVIENCLSIVSALLSVFDFKSLNLGNRHLDCMRALSRKMEESTLSDIIHDIVVKLGKMTSCNEMNCSESFEFQQNISEDISLIGLTMAETKTRTSSQMAVQEGLERVISLLSNVTDMDTNFLPVLPTHIHGD